MHYVSTVSRRLTVTVGWRKVGVRENRLGGREGGQEEVVEDRAPGQVE